MSDNSDSQRRQKAFLFEVEQAIRAANNEIIHEKMPEISRADIYHLAVTLANIRASYLETAFELNHMDGDEPDADLSYAPAATARDLRRSAVGISRTSARYRSRLCRRGENQSWRLDRRDQAVDHDYRVLCLHDGGWGGRPDLRDCHLGADHCRTGNGCVGLVAHGADP